MIDVKVTKKRDVDFLLFFKLLLKCQKIKKIIIKMCTLSNMF